MKKMVLAALLSVSAIGQVSAEVLTEASATVYLSDISDSYPVRLDAPESSSLFYPKGRMYANFNGQFKSVKEICFSANIQSSNPQVTQRNFYLWGYSPELDATGAIQTIKYVQDDGTKSNISCIQTVTLTDDLAKGEMSELYRIAVSGSQHTESYLMVDNITVTVKGEFIPNESVPETPVGCSEGLVYINGQYNSVGYSQGDYLTCDLEPNITYEMLTVNKGESSPIHNTSTFAEMQNVGVVYNKPDGTRRIKTISDVDNTYITTDGSVSFFYADPTGEDNDGGNYVKFKRVNLD